MDNESERGVEVTTAIYDELRRQCVVNEGEYEADAETGLFTINADLDLGAIADAVLATNPTTGWRGDMENAPRDGTPVLLWAFNEDEFDDWDGSDEDRPERAAYTACMNFQGLWWLPNSLRQVRMPTHWQPLPPPPTTAPTGRDEG